MSNNGYIGRAPSDSSVVVARETFYPSGVQTNFTFASNYDIGYLDVYLNGSRLIDAADYQATDGSTVGLTTYAESGDALELVAYKTFSVNNVTKEKNTNLTTNLPSDYKQTEADAFGAAKEWKDSDGTSNQSSSIGGVEDKQINSNVKKSTESVISGILTLY